MAEKIMGGVNNNGEVLPAKVGMWSKVKAFLLQDITVF